MADPWWPVEGRPRECLDFGRIEEASCRAIMNYRASVILTMLKQKQCTAFISRGDAISIGLQVEIYGGAS